MIKMGLAFLASSFVMCLFGMAYSIPIPSDYFTVFVVVATMGTLLSIFGLIDIWRQ
jgi:hypothetical protein